MLEIVEWLKGMEIQARDFYLGASRAYMEDGPFAKMLDALGQDEALHVKYMEKAEQLIRENRGQIQSAISLDPRTRAQIEKPFLKLVADLAAGKPSKEEILKSVLTTEFSEWNDIFLYVIQVLTPLNRELQLGASQIDVHRDRLKSLARELPAGRELLARLESFPTVWTRKFLVVDDNPAVAGLLKALYRGEAHVDGAENGKEALARVRTEHYDVILTDFEMPVMNGMAFFKEATAEDPGMGRRFLFLSGLLSREQKLFLEQRRLPFIQKPGGIDTIRNAVARVLSESATL